MQYREVIANYATYYQGDWNAIARAIQKKEAVHSIDVQPNYVTIVDDWYPKQFMKLRFPPWCIFYQGDLRLLQKDAVTIVGSRRVSDYGKQATKRCALALCKEHVLISGLARGVDGLVHETAIAHGIGTIGVIGCGLDILYPVANQEIRTLMNEKHLVLSEYPNGTKPLAYHFPWRNRMLAALGSGLVVTQASLKSGTMGTVNEALALSKEIYVVPWPLDDEHGLGCNKLIEQGANIICNTNELTYAFSKNNFTTT